SSAGDGNPRALAVVGWVKRACERGPTSTTGHVSPRWKNPMRKLIRTLIMAVQALTRNVLRSALTTLGIIIGVAAVIAMMETRQGSSAAIQKTIASMGANNL